MNSQYNIRQKPFELKHHSKQKMNYRSLSLLDRAKGNDLSKIRLNTEGKIEAKDQTNRSRRVHTVQSSNLKIMSKISEVDHKAKEKALFEEASSRDIETMELKPQIKVQNQWVNSVLPTLSAQALYQQNHQLKKQLNQLKQQNSILHSKLLMQKKQKQKLAKQLNLESEYYNFYERFDLVQNNDKKGLKSKSSVKQGFHPVNYMITGIKYRYEKLRQEYEQKCKEMERMLQLSQLTKVQEVVQENRALEKQNISLVDKVTLLSKMLLSFQEGRQWTEDNCFKSTKFSKDKIYNAPELSQSQTISQYNQSQISLSSNLIQAKNQLFQANHRSLTQQILFLKDQLSNRNHSLKAQQKSLTLLDNELYHKKKQITKLKKVEKQVLARLQALKKQNLKIRQQCQTQLQKTRTLTEKMFQKEKSLFLTQIDQKNQKISKLQKEVSYLSTLLKYLKPLQQQQPQIPKSQTKLEQEIQQSALKSTIMISNRKRAKTKMSNNNEKSAIQDFKLGLKEPVLSMKQSDYQEEQIFSQSEEYQDRQPKTSRQKHSENGFKTRKISPLEIQYLKEQIKYRCLGQRLSMVQIRHLFEANQDKIENLSKKDQNWQRKFITMKQLKQILQTSPFSLTKEQSHKLSRFIVQDTSAQHVYCDQQNQIQRQIVKSIIKAFVGKYELPNVQECKIQLDSIIKNYGKNLRLALDSLSEKGKIVPEKLFGLFQSLGISYSEQLKHEVIAKLYAKSQNRNLNLLPYCYIFDENFI